MAKNRLFATLLVLSMLFCGVFACGSFESRASDVGGLSARSAVLIEQSSGRVLFELNSHERLPMASTTKIMTAVVAIEKADLNMKVKVSPEAVGIEGSSVYLKAGEELTLSDLLYAVMLESANDAAAAVACAISGSVDAFVCEMNSVAERIGLSDTHFENPHGLDSENHYTSASDLARLAAYALKNPAFAEIVSARSAEIPSQDGSRYLKNHNRLLISYEGAIGVKTGFTKRSGRCLVSAAKRGEMTVIAVTLSAPDDWRDHQRMLDYAFDNYKMLTLAEKGEILYELPVCGGTLESVPIIAGDSAAVCVPVGECDVTRRIYLPYFKAAPIVQGDVAGYAEYTTYGNTVVSLDLEYGVSVQSRPVKRGFFEKIFK